MSTKNRKASRKNKRNSPTLAATPEMSLAGFRQVQVPDETSIKFAYSDFRSMTASVNQAEYVYRLNSLFDPDFTGVGGQPDGFDQWKALYSQYRVVACEVEVEAVGFSGMGFIAMGPSPNSASFSSAEEIAGLRKSKAGVFTLGQGVPTKLKRLYRIAELAGIPDEAILGNDDWAATVTGNPSRQMYIHLGAETAGASDIVYFWIKLTYYARLENAVDTLDTVAKSRRRFTMALASMAPSQAAASTTAPNKVVPKIGSDRLSGLYASARAPSVKSTPDQDAERERLLDQVKQLQRQLALLPATDLQSVVVTRPE